MFEEMASSTAELLLIAFLTIIFLFAHAIELKYFWELAKGKDPELQQEAVFHPEERRDQTS